MLVANIAILFQGFVDDSFKFDWEAGIQPDCRGWRSIQNGFEDHPRCVAPEWQRSSAHLIQHRAERKQVGASIEFLPSNLLRRHIGYGAEGRAGADRKSTRLNSSHRCISYAVFCLKKKK